MDHSRFVQSVEEARMVMSDALRCFTDEVIERWLQDNTWVEDVGSPCGWCQHMAHSGFSEEQCRVNVAGGGSCYRQVLKEVFIPSLRNALRGKYPTLDELRDVVYHQGPVWGGLSDMKLIGIVLHELGGTFMRMDA